jgi:hypothetical protein
MKRSLWVFSFLLFSSTVAAQENTYEITLTSNPPGAAIFVDAKDKLVGFTPYTGNITEGAHTFYLELSEHEVLSPKVIIDQSSNNGSFSYTLTKKPDTNKSYKVTLDDGREALLRSDGTWLAAPVAPKMIELFPDAARHLAIKDYEEKDKNLTKKILAAVDPKRKTNKCPKNPEFDTETFLSVDSTASGSFTGPGLNETIYVVLEIYCQRGTSESFAGWSLVVMRKDAPTIAIQLDDKSEFLANLVDVNQDGVLELLFFGYHRTLSTPLTSMNLQSILGGTSTTVETFDFVAQDCPMLSDGETSFVKTIRYLPTKGKWPTFKSEQTETKCESQ